MLLSLWMLFALAAPALGTTYDCGPNYASFKVLACANGVCTVDYTNPRQPTRRTRMYQKSIQTALAHGCHAENVNSFKAQAARFEANAAAMLRNTFMLRRAAARPAMRTASTQSYTRPRTQPQTGRAIVLGKYECYQLSMGELESVAMVNFTLHAGGRFTDIDGHPGTYSVSGNWVILHGTGLNGQRLRYTQGVPHSNHPPNLTYVRSGEDRESCDGQG